MFFSVVLVGDLGKSVVVLVLRVCVSKPMMNMSMLFMQILSLYTSDAVSMCLDTATSGDSPVQCASNPPPDEDGSGSDIIVE